MRCGVGSGIWQGGLAGAAEEFHVFPWAAAAGVACDDELEAGDEGEHLATGAGFAAGVGGDACAFRAASGGQFPAMGKRVGGNLEAEFR